MPDINNIYANADLSAIGQYQTTDISIRLINCFKKKKYKGKKILFSHVSVYYTSTCQTGRASVHSAELTIQSRSSTNTWKC